MATPDFRQRVIKYINHCKMVHRFSKSPSYRSMQRLKALDQCERLLALAKECQSTKTVASYTIMFRDHLQTILPVPTNSSYQSIFSTYSEILDQALTLK
jgi:hypothetical protein